MSLKSTSPAKPDWLPNWKDVSKYPDPANARGRVWAWEFLRRNPQYQQLWEKYKALPGPVYKGHSAKLIWEIRDSFERDFGVSIPAAPPEMTVEDPQFEWAPHFINQKPEYWVLPINDDEEFEMPEINLEHPAEVVVKFDLRAQKKSQLEFVDEILTTRTKRLTKVGVLRGNPRARLDKYLSYLRLLDAKLSGAKTKVIATEILGMNSDDPERLKESVRDAAKEAMQLRDGRYRFLAAWGT